MTKNSNAKNPNMRDPGPGLVGREGGTGGGSVGASTADPDLLGCPAVAASPEVPIHGAPPRGSGAVSAWTGDAASMSRNASCRNVLAAAALDALAVVV